MSLSTNELDPMFVKALGYLMSKSPDSTAKLKKMLDDAIEQSLKKKQDINFDKSVGKIGKHSVKITKPIPQDVKKKEKDLAQKRQFEKIQKDLLELDQEVSKKSRLDNSSTTSSFLSGDKFRIGNESKGSPLASDDKDFALEMDDLACVICKEFASEKGSPIECQECHNMYHRDCHQPPISEDANDPRCIWYCSTCTKKVAKQISSKPSTISRSNSSRESSFEAKNKSAFVTPFKRNELKPTLQSSGNGSSGGSLSGWAALSGKPIHQAPTSTKPQSSMQKPASANAQSRDKRDKPAKVPKVGPKLSASDAFAEALGADLHHGPSKSSSFKSSSGSKQSSSNWNSSSKSSMFPKAAANAEKRFQMMKKKAKLGTKKSK